MYFRGGGGVSRRVGRGKKEALKKTIVGDVPKYHPSTAAEKKGESVKAISHEKKKKKKKKKKKDGR